MRFLTARRLALVALAPALLLFSAVPGCSNESEGERCGDMVGPNPDDCTAPLVCTPISGTGDTAIDRCCNPNPTIVNDSRCVRSAGPAPGTDAGTSDASTSGGTAGTGGATAGGSGGTGDAATAGAADMSSGGI
jgi:hypothetical protein